MSYKIDIDHDKENSQLHVTLSVDFKPSWQGVTIYYTGDVVKMLNKQGYDLLEKDVVSKTNGKVRTDMENATKGKWVFQFPTIEAHTDILRNMSKLETKPRKKASAQKKTETVKKKSTPTAKKQPRTLGDRRQTESKEAAAEVKSQQTTMSVLSKVKQSKPRTTA